jgi:GTPase SAR1 family protein
MENNNNLKVLNGGKSDDKKSLQELMKMEEKMTTGEDKEMQELIEKEKEKSNYGEGLLMEDATVKTNPTTGASTVVGDEDVFSDDYVMPEEEEAKIKQIIETSDEEGKQLTIFDISTA